MSYLVCVLRGLRRLPREVGAKEQHALGFGQLNQQLAHGGARRSLATLPAPNGGRPNLGDGTNVPDGQTGSFKASYGFHVSHRNRPLREAQPPVTVQSGAGRYAGVSRSEH